MKCFEKYKIKVVVSYCKSVQFSRFCFKFGNFGNIFMRMCSVEDMYNFKGLYVRDFVGVNK